jgi:hypothetical protein
MAEIRSLKLALLADTKDFIQGLDKADKETRTFSSKLGDALKKGALAFAAVGAAAGAMAIKIGVDAVRGAIEDAKAQATLAQTLRNTTKATDTQIKSVEDYITKTERASAVNAELLRPSLDRLVRSTGDVTKAQKLQTLALDIAAGTGKDLGTITEGLAKAYDGNLGALKRLGIPLDESIIKAKDFDAAVIALSKTFEGQADIAANTFAGRMTKISLAIDEAKDELGFALLPFLEKFAFFVNEEVVPAMQGLVSALTGKDSIREATIKAGGNVNLLEDDFSQSYEAAFELGKELRNLAEATASLLIIDPQTGDSLLIKLIESFTTLIEKIETAISAYKRFKESFIGGALLDVSNLINPAVIAGRLATSGNILQAPNTTNYFNVKTVSDPQAAARAIVKVTNTALSTTGISFIRPQFR